VTEKLRFSKLSKLMQEAIEIDSIYQTISIIVKYGFRKLFQLTKKACKTMTICNANETDSTFAGEKKTGKSFEITNFSVEDQ
jgi:hypothetical protein